MITCMCCFRSSVCSCRPIVPALIRAACIVDHSVSHVRVCPHTKLTAFFFSFLWPIPVLLSLWFITRHILSVWFFAHCCCASTPLPSSLCVCALCVVLQQPQWRPLPPQYCRSLLSSLWQASWLGFRRPVSGFELHPSAEALHSSRSLSAACVDWLLIRTSNSSQRL